MDALIISLVTAWPAKALSSDIIVSSWTDFWSLQQGMMGKMFSLAIVIAVITVLYWALLEYKLSQSIGKMLMRIKVVSTTGKPLTFAQCLTRNLSKFSTILLALDTLYMFKSGTHRFLDTVATTQVIDMQPALSTKGKPQ